MTAHVRSGVGTAAFSVVLAGARVGAVDFVRSTVHITETLNVVHGYDGSEISLKGDGGPTCLTAPVWRSAGG